MSDYGLIVKNNSSEIQIDSLYKNFTLKDSGSLVLPSEHESATLNFADVTNIPLVAIRPTTVSFCALLELNKSGSTYISAAVGGEGIGGTIQWAMFINALSQSLPTYGLIVKNPSDEVVFSSDETYLKIIDVHSFSLSPSLVYGSWIDITVNDADNNYFILYPFSYFIDIEVDEEDPPTYDALMYPMGMKKISSTVIRIDEFLLWKLLDVGELDPDYSLWFDNCKLIEVGT